MFGRFFKKDEEWQKKSRVSIFPEMHLLFIFVRAHWAHHWANWSLLQGEPVATLEPSEYSKYLVCQNDCGAHPLVRTKLRSFGDCLVVTRKLATSGASNLSNASFRWICSRFRQASSATNTSSLFVSLTIRPPDMRPTGSGHSSGVQRFIQILDMVLRSQMHEYGFWT